MAMVSYIPVDFRINCNGCGGHNTEVELQLDGPEFLSATINCVCGRIEILQRGEKVLWQAK